MRIREISLIDLQSWEGENTIKVSPSKVVALKAPSETGKSLLFRFIIRFCSDKAECKDNTDLIRRGKECGAVQFTYEDGSSLILMLEKNGRVLAYYGSDGDLVEHHTDDDLNEQVFQRFGLVVDSKNNFSVNVFSRDLPMLFVNTSAMLNGAVLYRVMINRHAEQIVEHIDSQITEISQFIANNQYKKEHISKVCLSLQYVDTARLNNARADLQDVMVVAEKVDLAQELMTECLNLSQKLQSLSVPNIDLDYAKRLVGADKFLSKLVQSTTDLSQLLEQAETVSSAPFYLADVVNLQKVYKYFQKVDSGLSTLVDLQRKISVLESQLEHDQEELDNVKKTLGVCPLCGGEL